MSNFSKRYYMPILFLLLITISLWRFPLATPVLGIAFLLFSLAIAVSSIYKKHKQTENLRPKIVKDLLILILTLLFAIFLGGLAGTVVNQYAGLYFGVVAGVFFALAASFAAGYLVRWGMAKVVK
jgi:hypothetical protein